MFDTPYAFSGYRVDPVSIPTQSRDLRLDFFRGVALIYIFLDHIPSNVVNWLTIRNFGFSDAAEAFVFMSGYSAALAYGGRLGKEGFTFTAARILKRCWQLYVAQMLLLVAFTAEVAYTASTFSNPMFSEEMGIVKFFDAPQWALVQAMLLKFRPSNMDILPLYIVLLACFPAIIYGLWRQRWLLLAASFGLYLAAKPMDWNFPAWPDGTWMFNPLRWQFLFVLGAAFGLPSSKGSRSVPWLWRARNWLAPAAGAYLVAALLIVMTWDFPGLERYLPDWLERFMYPIDKSNLDPLRLIHFLALAYLVLLAVPANARLFKLRAAGWVTRCGQHPLEIFCLGLMLSFSAHVLLVEVSPAVAAQVAVSVVGIAIMMATGYYLAWYRRSERAASRARANQGPA